MITLFKRKDFLIDHLEGLIDMHNHILPGIDDGAKDSDESIEMIKGLSNLGITRFICTPHIMYRFYDNTPKSIEKSFKKLEKRLKTENLSELVLTYAAEHMIDENFDNIMNNDVVLTFAKNHLLIEMSYLQSSINFKPAVEKIKSKMLFPVFAHPERYQYLNTDYANYLQYKSLDLKFQLNLLSLGGYYGVNAKKMALTLLNSDLYDFMGSDVHSVKHIDALKGVQLNKKYVGKFLALKEKNNEALNF